MKLSGLILLIFFLIMAGCGPVPEFDIDQNVKDYVSYSPGSYWIYQDSADHSLKDSIIVISNIDKVMAGESGGKASKVEIIQTKYFSSRDSFYLIDGEHNVYGDEDQPGLGDYGNIDTVTTINYSFEEPYTTYTLPGGIFIPGSDSLKVNNKIYTNILQFRIPELSRTVFWSKHIGVIKSITRGRTWELDTCVVKQ